MEGQIKEGVTAMKCPDCASEIEDFDIRRILSIGLY